MFKSRGIQRGVKGSRSACDRQEKARGEGEKAARSFRSDEFLVIAVGYPRSDRSSARSREDRERIDDDLRARATVHRNTCSTGSRVAQPRPGSAATINSPAVIGLRNHPCKRAGTLWKIPKGFGRVRRMLHAERSSRILAKSFLLWRILFRDDEVAGLELGWEIIFTIFITLVRLVFNREKLRIFN